MKMNVNDMRKIFCASAVVAVVAAIVLLLLASGGCAEKGADFTVAYEGAGVLGYKERDDGSVTYGASAIVRNSDELTELCAEWNNPAFIEGAEGYDGELAVKLRAYDDGFFSGKALVFIFVSDVNGAREPKLKKLSVRDGGLEAEISLLKGNYADVGEAWIFVAETEASAVASLEKISVTTSERIK